MNAKQLAGQARHAQLRAALGTSGYRIYQQTCGRAGGQARQAQLRATLGEQGYRTYQHTLYQRAVAKHGLERMRAVLDQAREGRRRWRVIYPAFAEQQLHWLMLSFGFTLHADLTGGGELAGKAYRGVPNSA
jgi:hypothetical protein